MAKKEKKSFVLYYDYRQHLTLLNDEQRGRLLMALLDYAENGKEPDLEGAALMAFSFIRAQMDRDAEKYAETVRKRSEAGKQGGRPPKTPENNEKQSEAKKANVFQEKQNEAKKPDNDNENVTDNVTDNVTGTSSAPTGAPAAAEPTPYKVIVDMYHEICKSFPKLRNTSERRKKAIHARWIEYGKDLDTFRELFEMAEASPFLKGKNPRNWRADFNWLMNSENMAKVLEGNYTNDNGGQKHGEYSGNAERKEYREGSASETTLSGFRMA